MMDDTHREGKKKDLHPGSQMYKHSRLFMRAWIMVLTVAVLSIMRVGVSPADDQSLPSMTIDYQDGTITAIYEKTLDIDGRTYGLMPDVVIFNERGQIMDPGDLVVTSEVKFRVKNEQSDKIDKMIVNRPR